MNMPAKDWWAQNGHGFWMVAHAQPGFGPRQRRDGPSWVLWGRYINNVKRPWLDEDGNPMWGEWRTWAAKAARKTGGTAAAYS